MKCPCCGKSHPIVPNTVCFSDDSFGDVLRILVLLGFTDVAWREGADQTIAEVLRATKRDRRGGNAALTRVVARLAAGEEVNPFLRKVLATQLSNGAYRLEAKKSGRGRPTGRPDALQDLVVRNISAGMERPVAIARAAQRSGKGKRRIQRVVQGKI